jgi:hypothetical protein
MCEHCLQKKFSVAVVAILAPCSLCIYYCEISDLIGHLKVAQKDNVCNEATSGLYDGWDRFSIFGFRSVSVVRAAV